MSAKIQCHILSQNVRKLYQQQENLVATTKTNNDTDVTDRLCTKSKFYCFIIMTGYINSLISSVLVQGDPLHCDVSRIIINWNMINNNCSCFYKEKADL